jgi:hypothetical protein
VAVGAEGGSTEDGESEGGDAAAEAGDGPSTS